MLKIEDVENPQIGDFYLVKTVTFLRNENILNWPVMGDSHDEKEDFGLLSNRHYHIDWRFMDDVIIKEHREHNRKIHSVNIKINEFNAEYFSPIMKKEEISISYQKWQYLRDYNYNDSASPLLISKFKERNIKMKNLLCPHHGTKLKSCKIIDGVITCPQHGLKWEVKTGNLVC